MYSAVEEKHTFRLDGRSLWPATSRGAKAPREDYVFFASETPIYGHCNLTVFNDDRKRVQEVEQDQLTTTVTNHLFRIKGDPNEYNNIAAAHPDVVEVLAAEIRHRRSLHPINGARSELVPPPGWRAPKDWVSYPIPLSELQDEPAPGMPPTKGIARTLDMQHGERGRLVYKCETRWYLGGLCVRDN